MRKIIQALLLLVIFQSGFVYSQKKTQTFATNDRQIDLVHFANDEVMFLFDDFLDARIFYSSMRTLDMKINYNTIQDAVFVLNEQGKVSVLSTAIDFDSIVITDKKLVLIWIKGKGFFEKINGVDNYLISHRTHYEINEVKKGAYTVMPTTVNAERAQSRILHDREFIVGNHYMSLPNPSPGIVEIELTYKPLLMKILGSEWQPIPGKRELRKLFPDDRAAINEFLKETDISFHDKSDLVKLAVFMQSLQ